MVEIYMRSGNVIKFDGEIVSDEPDAKGGMNIGFRRTGHDAIQFLDQSRIEAIIVREEWA